MLFSCTTSEKKKISNEQFGLPRLSQLQYLETNREGNLEIDVYYQNNDWKNLADKIRSMVFLINQNSRQVISPRSINRLSIIVVSKNTLAQVRAIPSWINSVYYKGMLIVPIANESKVNWKYLLRSLKHEYSHALLYSVCKNACPVWIDEGLAMISEEEPLDPTFEREYATWITYHEPIGFRRLSKGFTLLNKMEARLAYVQSYLMTEKLISRYGMDKLSKFLHSQKKKDLSLQEKNFKVCFGISMDSFLTGLVPEIRVWARRTLRE